MYLSLKLPQVAQLRPIKFVAEWADTEQLRISRLLFFLYHQTAEDNKLHLQKSGREP